jgi:hypothetical protein
VSVNVVPAMAVIDPLARAEAGELAWPLGAGDGQEEASAATALPAAAVAAGAGVLVAAVPPPQAARRSVMKAAATAAPGLSRIAKHLP